MRTFYEAAAYLGTKTDRPLPGRATRVQRRDNGAIAVRYQATDVVTYHPDGSIRLDSGGWQTSTTKARFEEYAPIRVYSIKGVWYAHTPGAPWPEKGQGQGDPLYRDGMIVFEDGRIADPVYPTKADHALRRSLERQIRAYISGYVAAIKAGEVGEPGPGDCFMCQMVTPAVVKTPYMGFELSRLAPGGGAHPMGVDHYLSHFEEGYYVPAILWQALQRRGNPVACWHLITRGHGADMAAGDLRHFFKQIKPALLAGLGRR